MRRKDRMSEYTIVKGDCLWTISKSKYDLTSNDDIRKAISKLAEVNNIEDPNLIYTGNTLTLPDYDSIFNDDSKSKQAASNKYEEYENWQANAINELYGNPEGVDDVPLDDNPKSIDDIPDFEIIPEFSKDTYVDDMRNFAKQNIESYDKDKSGAIDLKEYTEQAVTELEKSGGGKVDIDEPATMDGIVTKQFESADESDDGNLQLNEYLKLSVEEFNKDISSPLLQLTYDEETNTVKNSIGDFTEMFTEEFNSIANGKTDMELSQYKSFMVDGLNSNPNSNHYKYDETKNKIVDTEDDSGFETQRALIEYTFKLTDINGDGVLDENEYGTLYTALDSIDDNEGAVDGKIKYRSTTVNPTDPKLKNLLKNIYEDYFAK